MAEVKKTIAVYETIATNKLGRKIDGEEEISLSHSDVEELYENISEIHAQANQVLGTPAVKPTFECRQYLFPILYKAALEVFEDICSSIPTLAKDLGKANPKVSYHLDGFYLNHDGEDLIRKTFIHILRNSMDHGIESPEERVKADKTIEGHISIEIRQLSDRFYLNYYDDGKGLNLKKIISVAKERKLIPSDADPDLNEASDLIFHSGLSTASVVSDISGRGVGMDAVRSYLRKHGASITTHLLERKENASGGYNFFFEIELPASVFATNPPKLIEAA